MDTQEKGFSNIALIITFVVIVIGVVGYFIVVQKSATPTPTSSENTQTQPPPITQGKTNNWVEYKWGALKFRYPAGWKIQSQLSSLVIIPAAQAATNDGITIGGGKSCATLGQGYRCETAFGLPIYTANTNAETVAALEEIFKSATFSISSRDVETGMAIETMYTVNNKIYTESEMNTYLKKTPAGRYDIVAKATGYNELPSYLVLPISQNSGLQFQMSPLTKPSELSDSYLQQFIKPGTGLLVGYIVDKDGRPLSGVAVSSPVQNVTSNNRGFYILNITIPKSASCAGVDVAFSKSGYKTEKHLHALSGSTVPHPPGGEQGPSFWGGLINIALQRGSGENVTDDTHKLCPFE